MTSAQQEGVYRAQARCTSGRALDVADVQAYVDRLTSSDWWDERYRQVVRVEVTTIAEDNEFNALGRADHDHGGGVIGLKASKPVSERTVLHEVAHTITPGGHGPSWVRTFLELTYFVRGSDAYTELRTAFVAEGVDVG